MKKVFRVIAVVLTVFSMGFLLSGVTGVTNNLQTASAAVLKQGSKGSEVTTMQRKLKNWGYYFGSVDGIFGAKTTEAVKYFQRKNGLSVDGIVGNQTKKALGMR